MGRPPADAFDSLPAEGEAAADFATTEAAADTASPVKVPLAAGKKKTQTAVPHASIQAVRIQEAAAQQHSTPVQQATM